jgi:hypothetical protein
MALVNFKTPSPLADVVNDDDGGRSEDKMFKYINDIKWKQEVKDCFVSLVDIFGLPDTLAPQSCGGASWHLKEGPFTCITIQDECVVSKRSSSYVKSFLYVSILYDLKRSKCMNRVFDITSSIMYDFEKKTLTARGESFASCVAMLMVATNIANCYPESKTDEIIATKVVEQAIEMAKELAALELFLEQLKINLKHSPGSTIVREL